MRTAPGCSMANSCQAYCWGPCAAGRARSVWGHAQQPWLAPGPRCCLVTATRTAQCGLPIAVPIAHLGLLLFLAGAKDMCTWAACFGLGSVVGLFCINPDAGGWVPSAPGLLPAVPNVAKRRAPACAAAECKAAHSPRAAPCNPLLLSSRQATTVCGRARRVSWWTAGRPALRRPAASCRCSAGGRRAAVREGLQCPAAATAAACWGMRRVARC